MARSAAEKPLHSFWLKRVADSAVPGSRLRVHTRQLQNSPSSLRIHPPMDEHNGRNEGNENMHEREYTRSGHQSQKGRENIRIAGTNGRATVPVLPDDSFGEARCTLVIPEVVAVREYSV
eukprot:1890273-Pyramimonas_sp.AAC.1